MDKNDTQDFVKISLIYKIDESFKIEMVNALKVGNYYQIKEVPIFSSNVAYDDIVSIEADAGHLFFEKVIKPSGHSVIHVAVLRMEFSDNILMKLRSHDITIYSVKENRYMAIDVPPKVLYGDIKAYLDEELSLGNLEYKEAAISAEHDYLGNISE